MVNFLAILLEEVKKIVMRNFDLGIVETDMFVFTLKNQLNDK